MKAKRMLSMLLAVVMVFTILPVAIAADVQPNKTVEIRYIFENSETAASSWTASLAAGSNYNDTVSHPTVVGYRADHVTSGEGQGVTFTEEGIELDIQNIQQDITITVTYVPAKVDYTVKYYQQNVDDDNYSLAGTATLTGLTGSKVNVTSKRYEGFYELLYDKDAVIAADGSTVVEVYYDRNYYLMTFNLGGGYGVEPVFARYGTPIADVGIPTRAGYTFLGWSLDGTSIVELPTTMPAEDRTYQALWQASETAEVTVVFWGENANDEGYSYIKSAKVTGKPGTGFGYLTCTQEEHTHTDSCYTCGQESHTHGTECYEDVGEATSHIAAPSNPQNGQIYAWSFLGSSGKSIYINGTWYKYSGNLTNKQIANPICGKTEGTHNHTDACLGCGKTEHTHDSGCYVVDAGLDPNLWKFVRSDTVTVAADGSSVVNVYYDRVEKTLTFQYSYRNGQYRETETITAKWGANIANQYVAIANNAGSTFWSNQENGEGPYTNYFGVMPETSATYYHQSDDSKSGTMTYWAQDIDGGDYSVKLFEVSGVGGYNVSDEDRYAFEGFTYHHGTSNGSDCAGATFYYTRNSYDLVFNNGYSAVKTEHVLYEAPLSTYANYTPEAPDKYEPNSVTFGGWYLNPECTGEQYDLRSHTMPANHVLLYAKWVPVSHTVEVYKDNTMVESVADSQTIPHGSFAVTPATPENGQYIFVGWFYMDNGVEKAFDFGSMPVRKDLKIYAKWSSNVLMSYTVHYAVKDANGTLIDIADPTTGSALAGSTKTFYAKGGDQLHGDYQAGYFPTTNSHSLTLDIADLDKNSYTFLYVQKDAVPYTVKYLEKETEKVLYKEKVVEGNRLAVVTETAVTISGYMPEVYQQRLVVTADGENVLIFYYVADTLHAMVTESHILLRDGLETPYSHTEYPGDIGTDYRASEMAIEGYVLDHADANGETYTPGDLVTLTGEGLHFVFYYKYNRFNVYYQSTQQTVTYDMADSFSVTDKVHEGYLYGGLYEDWTFTTPISDDSICGLEFAPKAGATYYVKEVPDSYLRPKIYYTYDMNSTPQNQLKGIYQVTAIDDLNYQFVGFDSREDAAAGSQAVTENTVYQNITVMKRTSWASEEVKVYNHYTLQSFFTDLNTGYLGVRKYTGSVEPNQTITFTPYFVTPDGVKVTGTVTRTVATNDGYCKGSTASGMTVSDSPVVSKCTRYEAPASTASLLSLRSTYTLNWDEPAATSYTVTKVDGGETTTQMVDSGDQTGKITYAGQTGKLFAGWFTDSAYTVPADFSHVQADMTVYAKYISADSVSTEVALKNKRSGELQGTVTMDEDLFSEVGLVWDYKGESEAVPASSKTVKRSLFSWIFGGETYQFSGVRNLAGLASRDTFTVTPYWVTQDGTVVHGAASSYMYYLNMIIRK